MDTRFIDAHTHTTFSSDSKMLISEAVDAALKQNLAGIAFSDHFDYKYTDHYDEFQFDFNEYFEIMSYWREKMLGKLDIYYAVEVGFQPYQDVYNEIEKRLKGFDFDYVIGSTHLMNGKDPYYGTFYSDHTETAKINAYRECLECIWENLCMYDDFDALGHFDYHTRYAPFADSRFYYRDFPDELDSILKHLVSNGKALEINTKTYVKNPIDTGILKRYKELGGELITIGSDAHSPEFVGLEFKYFADIIKSCGFDYLAFYKKRTPVLYKI